MSGRRVEIVISGVVQGVGFRYFAYRVAHELGVVGWVCNLPDGRVQVVAEGDSAQLEALVQEMKVGPRHASIRNVALRWSEAEGKLTTFNIQ